MKLRKYLHVAAIMFSSLASMLTHGQAKTEGTTSKKIKKTELSKGHRNGGATTASSDASQDPPPKKAGTGGKEVMKVAMNVPAAQTSTASGGSTTAPPLKLDPALMASAERSTPMNLSTNPNALAPRPEDENSRYPWKRQIVTTTFWIGENAAKNNPVPNHASSWDEKWAKNYGGTDDPNPAKRTSDYHPAAFTPGQNPFYIALPYNDIQRGGHKPEASKVIPWFNKEYKGQYQSVCKGRWIAIRYGNKVCYAQWEDAGPFRTDHHQYVFGNERPKPNLNKGAGLDVSPAVRDYLGMNGTDVTDWKFVDFDEIPQGPWAKYGENNTFVQNARKEQMRVAQAGQIGQETKAQRPVTLRDLSAPAPAIKPAVQTQVR